MADREVKIHVENLKKSFGKLEVLKDISMDIEEGEVVVLLGPSGSGKSTFLRCLNQLEKATGGTILVDGQCVTDHKTDINKLRENIGMVFQHFNLFPHKTVLENIMLAPVELKKMTKAEAREKGMQLLKRVGMADKAEVYPSQISGGQKQRVAIARALATNPKVLLCDEATSALDPASTRSILALLKDINAKLGITIVIITHEMSVIEEICQRVAIIDKSRIAECGNVREIFARPQSNIAKTLVFPNHGQTNTMTNTNCCRIVFDGHSSYEPVIANMVLEFKQPVNIILADSKNIGGRAFGQIVLQLPSDAAVAAKMQQYLQMKGLTVEVFEADASLEVSANDR